MAQQARWRIGNAENIIRDRSILSLVRRLVNERRRVPVVHGGATDVPPVFFQRKCEFSDIVTTARKEQAVRKSRFTEQQISFALKQAETGTPVAEVIRKMGVTEQTFYRWKKQHGSPVTRSATGTSI